MDKLGNIYKVYQLENSIKFYILSIKKQIVFIRRPNHLRHAECKYIHYVRQNISTVTLYTHSCAMGHVRDNVSAFNFLYLGFDRKALSK